MLAHAMEAGREQNPPEAENSSHSSASLCLSFSAKGDKIEKEVGNKIPAELHELRFSELAKVSLNSLRGLLFLVGKPFSFIFLSTLIFLATFVMFLESAFTETGIFVIFLKFIYSLISIVLNLLYIFLSKIAIKIFIISQKTLVIFKTSLSVSRKIIIILCILSTLSVGAATFIWNIIFDGLPSPMLLASYKPNASSKIYDRNGVLLYQIYKEENRTPVSLSQIPSSVILSTLASEDKDYYKHHGISLKGILRAAYIDITEKKLYGGSTITQQLIKNTLITPEKSLTRKLREIVLALQVETIYSKDEILEMYLNEVSYGGTIYGIQEAAKKYFGKDASNLDLAQSALLAGLPKSPSRFSPYSENPQNYLDRQKEVLKLMLDNSFITEDEYQNALNEKLNFAKPAIPIFAPHFVIFTKEFLEKKYGQTAVEAGGLNVTTSLDLNIQKMVDGIITEELSNLAKYKVGNAAAIVVNPQNGQILAMAGSKNYFDSSSDGQVNVLTTLQQPGSSIKIINYTYALSHGYTASSIIDDSPVTFNVKGSPPYSPKNYDGAFKGKLTLRNAFAQSRNVPAVKVLASYGVDKMIALGQKMGITTWTNPKNYGLSITLGGGDVKLYDLAQVYAVIANYGNKVDFNPVLKISDYNNESPASLRSGYLLPSLRREKNPSEAKYSSLSSTGLRPWLFAKGDKIYEENNNPKGEQIIDPRIAYILTDILKDNNARSPAFGRNSLLNIKDHKNVAVKTGTSNNLRDNMAIGYNQNYLVAVWVGNNDNSPMARIASGVTGATPIFNKIMTNLLSNQPDEPWAVPNGLIKAKICYSVKKPDSEEIETKSFEDYFLKENSPKNTCSIASLPVSPTPMP